MKKNSLAAVAVLSGMSCEKCMRYKGHWVPDKKTPQSTLEDIQAIHEKMEKNICMCGVGLLGIKSVESSGICNKFVYRDDLKSRVLFGLRFVIPMLLVADIAKYSINLITGQPPRLIVVIIDLGTILFNIAIQYGMNKFFLRRELREREKIQQE